MPVRANSASALKMKQINPAGLRFRHHAVLALSDCLAIALGFFIANRLWLGEWLNPFGLSALAAFAPIYLLVATNRRVFAPQVLGSPRLGVIRSLQSIIGATASFLALLFVLKVSADFSRPIIAIGVVGSAFFVSLGRMVVGHFLGRQVNWLYTRQALILDDAAFPGDFDITIDAQREKISPSSDDPQMLDKIRALIRECEKVVIACPPARRMSWAECLRGAATDIHIVVPEINALGAIRLETSEGRSSVLVATGPLGMRDAFVKRAFDICLSLLLIILLSPLLLVVAIAIKFDSPGPVLFRQERMGAGYRLFEILKFRTMRTDTSDARGSVSTVQDDKRLTRIGRWLRKTSTDELPQLWNVLRGEMSIVGPRPHALGSQAEGKHFWQLNIQYWERHSIKPGMTGLAQVRGFRGATHQKSDLSNRLECDLEYIATWSLWNDLLIILKTVTVLVHEKAY